MIMKEKTETGEEMCQGFLAIVSWAGPAMMINDDKYFVHYK